MANKAIKMLTSGGNKAGAGWQTLYISCRVKLQCSLLYRKALTQPHGWADIFHCNNDMLVPQMGSNIWLLLNLFAGIQKAWLPSNIRGLGPGLVTSQAQIHSWSFWVLMCAKPKQAACHCLTQATQNRRWSVLKIYLFIFWKGSDGQQVRLS